MKQPTVFKRLALAAALALGFCASAHAQKVVRDELSGQLRAPTAEESKALDASVTRAPRAVGLLTGKVNPQPEVLADGTVAQELDTSTLMYSVAKRNADGTVSQYCVVGPDAADRLIKAPASKKLVASKSHKEHGLEVK